MDVEDEDFKNEVNESKMNAESKAKETDEDIAEKLRLCKEMVDDGIFTQHDYDLMKKDLLGE